MSLRDQPDRWSLIQPSPLHRRTKYLMERATRIELAFSAWEADVLPLNYARRDRDFTRAERVLYDAVR